MHQMPNELVAMISEFLPHEYLHNFRLVSRKFAALGASKLFRRLVLHASYASINRLCSVAKDPKLRIHVKTLV
jgi:hypothetical protein